MSDDDLKADAEVLAKMTPGPWRAAYPRSSCKLDHGNFCHGLGECKYTFDGWQISEHTIHRDPSYRPDDEVKDEDMVAGNYDRHSGGIVKANDAAGIAHLRNRAPAWLDELTRLRAIVSRLPLSADGVPLVPGMTVYPVGTDICGENGPQDGTIPHVVGSVAKSHAWIHPDVFSPADAWDAKQLRSAALAARAPQGTTGENNQ